MSAAPHHDPSLTGDSSVAAVIAAYVDAADPAGSRRDLRSALSHIDAELGTRPIRTVRPRHVVALLDDLHAAGLSPRRNMAVTDALHSLFGFAVARGLVASSPIIERTQPAAEPVSAPPPAQEQRTPTLTMVALGARVAWWTMLIVTVVFALLMLGLVVELA
jgi:hypothetical protein